MRVEVLVHGDELIRHIVAGQTVLEYSKAQIGGGAASPTDPVVKVDGTPLTGGYISIQAETARCAASVVASITGKAMPAAFA